jgi:hypothetical protein
MLLDDERALRDAVRDAVRSFLDREVAPVVAGQRERL